MTADDESDYVITSGRYMHNGVGVAPTVNPMPSV